MPKALTLSNGGILVGLDHFGLVRDFYFPYIGLENQVGGHYKHRVGAFAEGQLSWWDDGSWDVAVGSKEESHAGTVRAEHRGLGIAMNSTDLVYNESNVFVRRISIKNLRGSARNITVFFGQQFEPYESHRAHTAYYDPLTRALIHYRGKRVFLINAKLEGVSFDDYTTGVSHAEGKEGSHRDAEDGVLAKNPIEHGNADSVMGLTTTYAAGEEKLLYYWVCVAKSFTNVRALNTMVLEKGPAHIQQTTEDFWRAWINRQRFSFHGLPPEAVQLFNKSLFTIRAHADRHGAIIASSDSDMMQYGKDSYAFLWPRDGSYAALALDQAGDFNVCQRFFEFANRVITDQGYFLHKYSPDGSLGSSWHAWVNKDGSTRLPIQEDETAMVLVALAEHYRYTRDLEFIESLYNSLIRRAADFMISYRDEKTGLPLPSHDLWEERYATHTYTAAAVYGALCAAAEFADTLGKAKSHTRYLEAAKEIREAVLSQLWDAERGVFIRGLTAEGARDRNVDASSSYGIFRFGLLPVHDERLQRSFASLENTLTVRTPIGGIARYENDRYYSVTPELVGNPWIITTLWLAEYYTQCAASEQDLERVKKIFLWVTQHADATGLLAEQLHPYHGTGLSAVPLVWSHAAFVSAVVRYLDKLEELGVCKACDPLRMRVGSEGYPIQTKLA